MTVLHEADTSCAGYIIILWFCVVFQSEDSVYQCSQVGLDNYRVG